MRFPHFTASGFARKAVLLPFVFLFASVVNTEGSSLWFRAGGDSTRSAVKVYLNCNYGCYQDYLKSQTTWAYFVQDQFVADVNLRINSLSNGSGGSEFKLIFEGQGKIAHLSDTVSFSTNGIQTENEIRSVLLKHVQLGLVRYAMQTESHEVLSIISSDSSDRREIGQGSNPEEDPFNAWVYNVSIWGNGDGQKSNRNSSYGGGFSAGQVKETHKVNLAGRYNTRINNYDYLGEKSRYQVDNYWVSGNYSKALTQHWSLGTFNSWTRSTYDNFRNSWVNQLALEYNVFPYKESQTRQLTATLFAGSRYNQYRDTTIYLKTREWRPIARFNLQGTFNPSWGSASVGLNNRVLLDDFSKYSSSLDIELSARIFKGLSLRMYSSFSLIRNQINLPKQDASIDQVLLSQQIIATSYSYYFYVSLNYRFGSIFNNVVNTRFMSED